MLRTALSALVASLFFVSASAFAVQPDEVLKDPALESRARALSTGLRCLVCQNQSIDDSDAPLARDLRILLRERLKAGDSDEQVMSYLVDRYGEFVRLNPVFGWHTLVLWLGPFVLLIGAAGMLVMNRRKTVAVPEENTLSDADAKKFKELSSKAE